jgi:hypothetical protein
LIALSAPLFVVVFHHTRRIKKATRERKGRRDGLRHPGSLIVDVRGESLWALRIRTAAYGGRKQESVDCAAGPWPEGQALPMVDMIIAVGTCLVLWFAGAWRDRFLRRSLVLFIWYLGRMYADAGTVENDRRVPKAGGPRADPRG